MRRRLPCLSDVGNPATRLVLRVRLNGVSTCVIVFFLNIFERILCIKLYIRQIGVGLRIRSLLYVLINCG